MPDDPESTSTKSSPSGSFDLAKLRTSRRVSWLLDECIRIPGTNLRFGLDPILGLFPYGGETVATVIGATILGEAGSKGIPFKSLLRMGGNMLINAGVGTLPFVGDLFSAWFKSNTRNYKMLNTWLESDDGEEASGGWWPIIFIGSVIVVVLVLNVISWILMGSLFLWGYREIIDLFKVAA